MSDTGENITRLAIGLAIHVLGKPVELRAAIGGDKGWTFEGQLTLRERLSSLIARLQAEEGASEDWFAAAPPADIDIHDLAVSYASETGSFSLRSNLEVEVAHGPKFDLSIIFARTVPLPDDAARQPEPDHGEVLAGIFSRSLIDFASVIGPESGLIGRFLGGLSLDRLSLIYSSAAQEVDGSLIEADEAGSVAFTHGLSVTARLGSGGNYTEITLPPPEPDDRTGDLSEQAPTPTVRTAGLPVADGSPMRMWKQIDKTIGPLQLRRIGGEWHEGKLGILLDAEVALAGLTVGLAGLAVRVPPSKLTTLAFADLEFGLDGLELAFARGPVAIAGSLLRTNEKGRVGYAGLASIRAATFSIAAMGAYSTTREGEPAFFIYGAYQGIIGGPPCLVVTAIAAGFGYNRAIVLPEIDEVRDFPLVSLVMGHSDGKSSGMAEGLGRQDRFPAVTGQYWLAAGIRFTSFKLVDAFALVTAQFGTRFEIAILGVATLRQPPEPAPRALVFVEMALKARFAPDDGLLSVMAVLTENSYLFDPSCKLTGGFAFCVWLPPSDRSVINRAGDFVLTLGGYHPRFQVPAHYPKVPRIGFNWQLPECGVTIRGEAYFALTPSFIMAGVRLSAVFRAGDFSAWFEGHADFLIGWAPLHYEAEVGVRIGAAYVLRIGSLSCRLSFELAAMLKIWGPPFAGEAHVDLGIVAFTIPIGDQSASRQPPRIWWPTFEATFLPEEPLSITLASGLVAERDGKDGYVIVNPSELCLAVQSFIPITRSDFAIRCLDPPQPVKPAPSLGIRPTRQEKLESSLYLAFSRDTGGNPVSQEDLLAYRPVLQNAPEALWSSTPMPDAKTATTLSANVIEDVLMGVQILPAECRTFGRTTATVTISSVAADLRARPDYHHRDAPYEEPERRAAKFRSGWKLPDAALVANLAAFGFAVPAIQIGPQFPAIWQATPTLAGPGELPAEHGA